MLATPLLAADREAEAARQAKDDATRQAKAARDAALARAADAEREAAATQQERAAAEACLHAALDRAALECAAAGEPKEDDNDASAAPAPDLHDAILQHEAAALLDLHALAVVVQNIRLLVPLVLDVGSTFYGRWRESFLLAVGHYSLQSHVLTNAAAPPDWARMDCVVRTWITGPSPMPSQRLLSSAAPQLAPIGSPLSHNFVAITKLAPCTSTSPSATSSKATSTSPCTVGNSKGIADALRDLSEPVNYRTLVLNLLCGLNGRFEAIEVHLRRGHPFPTFLQARNDLLLEELTMAESTAPTSPTATALTATAGVGRPL